MTVPTLAELGARAGAGQVVMDYYLQVRGSLSTGTLAATGKDVEAAVAVAQPLINGHEVAGRKFALDNPCCQGGRWCQSRRAMHTVKVNCLLSTCEPGKAHFGLRSGFLTV